ncbi:hypothetical protein MO973_11835 [Paenibacillus sp. TRM 82003]|nr:hypothetical protein [Paenibacillus sp. TRM 82003]
MEFWKAIGRALGFGSKGEAPPYSASELGDGVGLADGVAGGEALRELERRLASACRATFMEQVRSRVIASRQDMTDAEYDWALLELRRFFFLTAIACRQVPMYSEKADAVWHEMLLFSREYETFCDSFAGRRIHHEPHTEQSSRSAAYRSRLEFELLYGTLFRRLPMNERLLGPFGKHTFSADEVTELGHLEEADIRERFFRDTEAGREAAAALARSIVSGVEAASNRSYRTNDPRFASDYAAGIIAVSLIHSAASDLDDDRGDDDGGAAVFGGDGGNGSDGGGDGGGASCGGGCGGS